MICKEHITESEVRRRKSLVLERLPGEDKVQTKGGATSYHFELYNTHLRNCYVSLLVGQLNYFLQHLSLPVINGTGYTGSIDIDLDMSMTALPDLRQALQQYNLDLVEKEMEIKVLVIRDRKQDRLVMKKPGVNIRTRYYLNLRASLSRIFRKSSAPAFI